MVLVWNWLGAFSRGFALLGWALTPAGPALRPKDQVRAPPLAREAG